MSSDLYLITLVFHEHTKTLDEAMKAYEERLAERNLPDIPFHMVDLHGHGYYEAWDGILHYNGGEVVPGGPAGNAFGNLPLPITGCTGWEPTPLGASGSTMTMMMAPATIATRLT